MIIQCRLSTLLVAVPLSAFLLIATPACDALTHGPYSTWFNRRCRKMAELASLVGKPEKCIMPMFGPPNFFYATDSDALRTYNYAPVWYFPTAKFQVHCQNGIVTYIEEFDD